MDAVELIQQPIWDDFVNQIKAGHYTTLVSLRDNLQKRLDEAKSIEEDQLSFLHEYEVLLMVISLEILLLGKDSRLWDTLERPFTIRSDWHWCCFVGDELEAQDEEDTVTSPSTALFELRLSPEFCRRRSVAEHSFFARYPAEYTWAEVLNKVLQEMRLAEEGYNKAALSKKAIQLRLETLNMVLQEYELSGRVRSHAEVFPPSKYPEIVLEIIRKGLEVFDANPDRFSGRQSLIDEIAGESNYEDWKTLRDFLVKHGLYTSNKGQGRPRKEKEEKLLSDTIRIWRHVLDNQ